MWDGGRGERIHAYFQLFQVERRAVCDIGYSIAGGRREQTTDSGICR